MGKNLPRYLLYILITTLACSVIGGILFDGGVFIVGLGATGAYLSPILLLILVVHKIFTWKFKNNYFYPVLGLLIILISLAFYMVSHVF